jgi:hypothetical protein
MITTAVTFYQAAVRQYYLRLIPGIVGDEEKDRLCRTMNAVLAASYPYNRKPSGVNLLYFQEFEKPDTEGFYFNIDGDRQVFEVLQCHGQEPEYVI